MQLRREPGGVALYRQIAEVLRDRIARDGLKPGDRLPSEPELAEQCGVARATVAKALDLLVADGLVVRRQGSGTFVALPPLSRQLPELTSFTEHVESLGRKSGQRLVTYTRIEDPSEDPLLAAFDRPVVVVERVRLIDDEPVGLHRTGVPEEVADQIGFTQERLETTPVSLYRLLEDHGIALVAAEEHLRAVNADRRQARLLGIRPSTALMQVRRLSRDRAGRLVEAVDAFYLGHLYDYRIELVRSITPTPMEDQNAHQDAATRGSSGPRIAGRGMRRQ